MKTKSEILFLIISFLLVGLGIALITVQGRGIYRNFASSRWPRSKGEIVAASSDTISSIKGTVYKTDVTYRYSVQGSVYVNKGISCGDNTTLNPSIVAQHLQKYKPGTTVMVYFNPNEPSVSCLEPEGVHFYSYVRIIVGVVFIAFGLFFCTIILWPGILKKNH